MNNKDMDRVLNIPDEVVWNGCFHEQVLHVRTMSVANVEQQQGSFAASKYNYSE